MYILYTYLNKDNHKKLLEQFLLDYSIDFQEKIKRYRRWQNAQASLLGRMLLFKGIEKFDKNYLEEDLKYSKYKKPYFLDEQLKFNISHSGELVVIIISDSSEVGIDVELMNTIHIENFKPQMTKTEWNNILLSSNMLHAFYTYWTAKEAVVKAHGMGLAISLKSFEIIDNIAILDEYFFYIKEIEVDSNYKCFISSTLEIKNEEVKVERIYF
jgi:4'-phosphopantetheinyl transferase